MHVGTLPLPFPALNWFTFGRNNAAFKTEIEKRKLYSTQMNWKTFCFLHFFFVHVKEEI